MRRPLKPWSEGWVVAVEGEKERLEAMRVTDLYTDYKDMLLDEVCTDVAFANHIGPWIDCEHEEECWESLFAETATLTLWEIKKRVDRNTRNLIDVWLMNTAERNVASASAMRWRNTRI